MTADLIDDVLIMETHHAGDRVFINFMLDAEGIVY